MRDMKLDFCLRRNDNDVTAVEKIAVFLWTAVLIHVWTSDAHISTTVSRLYSFLRVCEAIDKS